MQLTLGPHDEISGPLTVATRLSLESGARARHNAYPGGPLVRRTLPHLLLAILAFAGPAVAQIAMPNGVALSPFPVAQQPAAYQTFGDGAGGVWAVFQGAQVGSALYAQHVDINGGYALGFRAAARAITHSGTQVNHLWAAPDGVGGAAIIWYGSNPKDSTVRVLALRLVRFDAQGDIPPTFSDTVHRPRGHGGR